MTSSGSPLLVRSAASSGFVFGLYSKALVPLGVEFTARVGLAGGGILEKNGLSFGENLASSPMVPIGNYLSGSIFSLTDVLLKRMAIWTHDSKYRRSIFIDGCIKVQWWEQQLNTSLGLGRLTVADKAREAFCTMAQDVWWRETRRAIEQLDPDDWLASSSSADLLCLQVAGRDISHRVTPPPSDVLQERDNELYLPLCLTFPAVMKHQLTIDSVMRELPYEVRAEQRYKKISEFGDFVERFCARLDALYWSPSLGASTFLYEQGGLVQRSICDQD